MLRQIDGKPKDIDIEIDSDPVTVRGHIFQEYWEVAISDDDLNSDRHLRVFQHDQTCDVWYESMHT